MNSVARPTATTPLWSKIGKNTDKIAIQSFTVPRANGRASGPVLQSVFLAVFDHSACPIRPILFRPVRCISKYRKSKSGKDERERMNVYVEGMAKRWTPKPSFKITKISWKTRMQSNTIETLALPQFSTTTKWNIYCAAERGGLLAHVWEWKWSSRSGQSKKVDDVAKIIRFILRQLS